MVQCVAGTFECIAVAFHLAAGAGWAGRFTKQGSALLIMGVAGGAVTPLLYGILSDRYSPQLAYWVLAPCYAFVLLFAVTTKPYSGYRRPATMNKKT